MEDLRRKLTDTSSALSNSQEETDNYKSIVSDLNLRLESNILRLAETEKLRVAEVSRVVLVDV
jgi:hypothetical protein